MRRIFTVSAGPACRSTRANPGHVDSEHDIEKLIEKTETEGDQQETRGEEVSTLFSFAKVWAADKDALEEMDDNPPESVEPDAWAQTLQKIAAERDTHQIQEETGRGTRRKAAAVFPVVSCRSNLMLICLTTRIAANSRFRRFTQERKGEEEEKEIQVESSDLR